jgi:DNA-binding transcriptional ArsR family regulator
MGWWQVDADTLAGSRFVVSPLPETLAALFALEANTAAHRAERAWLDAHVPAYRARLAGDPAAAQLVRAVAGDRWIADFLCRPPSGDPQPSLADELAPLRATPDATARADLAVTVRGPLPAALDAVADIPGLAADLLEWVWTTAVLPYWARRRRILEADVVARTAQVGRGGWAAALDGMRPGTRWLGDGRLQINAHANPPRDISGARLFFVPVTARHGWVSWDIPHRYAVVYPCAGTLAYADAMPVPRALGRLLGPARAGVLVLLDTPKSTTQLVALTGQGLGSVGRHLRVLREAGLAGRRRAGRSVLYHRTAAGQVLVDVSSSGRAAGR